MRFFKYLVFIFLFLFSFDALAKTVYYVNSPDDYYDTEQEACLSFKDPDPRVGSVWNGSSCSRTFNGSYMSGLLVSSRNIAICPSKNEMSGMQVTYFPYNTPVPTRTCTEIEPGKFCVFESQSDHPLVTNGVANQMVVLWSKSTTPASSCKPAFDGVCDKNDPYGGCYTPPNDNCTRQIDGSIVCPDNQPPPIEPQGCTNGASYCKRPPSGCGPDYVSGTFNGEQLCVKKGPDSPADPPIQPNDPSDPDDPNKCYLEYCPKPDQGKDCPDGYYTSTYNGQKICVKDNPTPNQPNPNDPNNTDGGDDGGDAGGGDGSTVSVNLKPVLDAINSLKAALLTSLETLSRKLSSLVDGQKESNQHLKVIKNEVTKTNEKLDTANGHLEKIEEATTATSDAIGETNDKLDRVFSDEGKEQIEQLGEQSTDSRLTAAETEMTSKLQSFANALSYSSSHACISDLTVTNIPYFGSMTVPFSQYCDLLALIKLLLKLATLMLALRIIYATVWVF